MTTKNTQTETADAGQNRVEYVCVSIPAWIEQATRAIAQGQSEIDFLANCHPDNRSNAGKAYRMVRAARPVAEYSCGCKVTLQHGPDLYYDHHCAECRRLNWSPQTDFVSQAIKARARGEY